MTAWMRYVRSACLVLLWVASLGWTVGSISGCTTTVTTNGVKEVLTDSDESEVRKRARIRLELALGYFSNGKTEVALDNIKQAIAIDAGLYEAYDLRGLIYMRMNEPALAEESFRRALAINPKAAGVQQNYGWFLCQQRRFTEGYQQFNAVLANPLYGDRAKTLLTLGMCQDAAGQRLDAEASLQRSYELDAGNPVTGYQLAVLMYKRRDFTRAKFYASRINNSELANAETLWLGVRIERQLGNREAMSQLGAQLKKRFPQAPELSAYERGAFDE